MNRKIIYLKEKIKKILGIPTKCIICSHCKYGYQNFWFFWECYATEKRIDTDSTKYTAIREKHHRDRCIDNTCEYYEHV